jgi:hypothetical protein
MGTLTAQHQLQQAHRFVQRLPYPAANGTGKSLLILALPQTTLALSKLQKRWWLIGQVISPEVTHM